jgi:putative molybdopterin biosynthesis protein
MLPRLTHAQLKLLADPRRMAILRLLMASPRSLTNLGAALVEHPAWVRHHLKSLEQAELVLFDHSENLTGHVEKFYRAAAPALLLQELVLPDHGAEQTVVLQGSHDLALEDALAGLSERHPDLHILSLPVGSLDGLIALRQGLSHAAGCHLLDTDSDEYNLPYVRRLFPGEDMLALTVAWREQGLLTAPDNPLGLHSLADLARPDVRFANRQPGSGTRLWLDRQLDRQGIPSTYINGYAQTFPTHTAVAAAIRSNQAGAGIALAASAHRFGLHFTPLFMERFDLILPKANLRLLSLQPLLDLLASAQFRFSAAALGGYDTSQAGTLQSE